MKTLFIHGGPGFNSQPERLILAPHFSRHNIEFFGFDEPSQLRPIGGNQFPLSFDSLVNALSKVLEMVRPESIIAHSWGLYPLFKSLSGNQNYRPDHIILVSPIFDLFAAHREIANATLVDFEETDPSKAKRISECLNENKTMFDGAIQEALMIAMGSPNLFARYWNSPLAANNYFGAMADPKFQLDVQNFIQILSDFSRNTDVLSNYSSDGTSINVVIGANDFYSRDAMALHRFEKHVPNFKLSVMENANHFPHIEKPAEFAELVARIS